MAIHKLQNSTENKTDTMKKALVSHLLLIRVLIQRIYNRELKPHPKTFWNIA